MNIRLIVDKMNSYQLKTGEGFCDPILKAISSFDYEVREYQCEITQKGLNKISRGQNLLISLPPGTGKTIIAQIIAWYRLNYSANKNLKTLFLLPNNNLLMQHYEYSMWLHNNFLCTSLLLDSNWKSNKKLDHYNSVKSHNFLFALPRLFENLFVNDYLSADMLKTIRYIFIDEYDSYSKSIINDYFNTSINFKKDFSRFRKLPFHGKVKYIFMSATPSYSDFENKNWKSKSIWAKTYNPKLVQVEREKYSKYIPVANIIPIGCFNSSTMSKDQDITKQISKIYNNVLNYLKSRITDSEIFSKILLNIDDLLKRNAITLPNGKKIDISAIHHLIIAYKKLKNERVRLFEDFDTAFDDMISHSSKINVLIKLAKSEIDAKRKIVVFIRYIDRGYVIKEALSIIYDIQSEVVHGDFDNETKNKIINRFKKGKIKVLIATRDLFGRGFDLPQAKTAIFYSPKENVRTVWQEFLRIRSTRNIYKNTFVLFYQWTKEAYKMYRLLISMQAHGMNRSTRVKYKYRWEFVEEEIINNNKKFFFYDYLENENYYFSNFYKKDSNPFYTSTPRQISKIELFSVSLFKLMKNTKLFDKSFDTILSKLKKLVSESKLLSNYKKDFINSITNNIAEVFDSSKFRETDNLSKRRGLLFFKIHPDYCKSKDEDELKFCLAVTQKINVLYDDEYKI